MFQLFLWVRLVELEGRPLVLNLAPHHETAVRLLGAQRYYLLEVRGVRNVGQPENPPFCT